MHDEVVAAGWEIAGEDAWPRLTVLNTVGASVSDERALHLAAALDAIARSALTLPRLFGRRRGEDGAVIEDPERSVVIRRDSSVPLLLVH